MFKKKVQLLVSIKYNNLYQPCMKKLNTLLFALVVATLSSCQVIGGIAKISFTAGIIITLVVIFLIIWLISAFRGKN
jgi:ABC-type multidrug transport system permease subunit